MSLSTSASRKGVSLATGMPALSQLKEGGDVAVDAAILVAVAVAAVAVAVLVSPSPMKLQ